MEAILAQFVSFFLVSGTVGTYALLTLVLLVFFYFKYLKPFFNDVTSLSDITANQEEMTSKQLRLMSIIEHNTERLDEVLENNQVMIRAKDEMLKKVETQATFLREFQNGLKKTLFVLETTLKESHIDHTGRIREDMVAMKDLLKNLMIEIEKTDSHASDKLNNLLVELARLSTKIEYGQRGLMK